MAAIILTPALSSLPRLRRTQVGSERARSAFRRSARSQPFSRPSLDSWKKHGRGIHPASPEFEHGWSRGLRIHVRCAADLARETEAPWRADPLPFQPSTRDPPGTLA